MPPRIALFILLLSMGVAGAAEKKNDAEMDFRLVAVPASVFSSVDSSSRDGARKPKPGVRRIEGGELNDFDVRELLSKYGVSFPAGSAAHYDGALIVYNTARNLALIDRIFGKMPPENAVTGVSIGISTYACTLPPAKKLLPWEELMAADVFNLPPASVKLIDYNSISTKSGQRGVSDRVKNPPKRAKRVDEKDGDQSRFPAGETASMLEVEPVAGSDRQTIDINIAFHLRTQAANAGGNGYADLECTTSFASWDDYPVVIHSAPVENQPGRYFVVIARAKLLDRNEWKLPPPKPGTKPGIMETETNIAGQKLPRGMILKRYKFPPGFLTITREDGTREVKDPKKTLEAAGVQFPTGSKVIYDNTSGTLIMINTQENHDLMDQIVESILSAQPCVVSAELSAYECDFSNLKDTEQLNKLTFAGLEQRPQDSVKMLGCVSVLTKSGQRVVTIDVSGPDLSKVTNTKQAFQAAETRTVLEVEPVVGPDSRKIDTNVAFQLRLAPAITGSKEMLYINSSASFTSESGDPHVVSVSPMEDQKDKYIVVVMRMRVLSPGGWNVKNPSYPVPVAPIPQVAPANDAVNPTGK